jgi:hypothetical protein
MTDGRAVLENLRLHGIQPKLADGKLKLVGRQSQITSAIVAAVVEHKPEILALLKIDSAAQPAAQPDAERQTHTLATGQGNNGQALSKAEVDRRKQVLSIAKPDEGHADSRTTLDPAIRAEIERIEAEARRLGWPEWRLWCAEFWPGPRGLAAVMDSGDKIDGLTAEFIAIVKPNGNRLRFFHHDC